MEWRERGERTSAVTPVEDDDQGGIEMVRPAETSRRWVRSKDDEVAG